MEVVNPCFLGISSLQAPSKVSNLPSWPPFLPNRPRTLNISSPSAIWQIESSLHASFAVSLSSSAEPFLISIVRCRKLDRAWFEGRKRNCALDHRGIILFRVTIFWANDAERYISILSVRGKSFFSEPCSRQDVTCRAVERSMKKCHGRPVRGCLFSGFIFAWRYYLLHNFLSPTRKDLAFSCYATVEIRSSRCTQPDESRSHGGGMELVPMGTATKIPHFFRSIGWSQNFATMDFRGFSMVMKMGWEST